jgi:hypothetical protein
MRRPAHLRRMWSRVTFHTRAVPRFSCTSCAAVQARGTTVAPMLPHIERERRGGHVRASQAEPVAAGSKRRYARYCLNCYPAACAVPCESALSQPDACRGFTCARQSGMDPPARRHEGQGAISRRDQQRIDALLLTLRGTRSGTREGDLVSQIGLVPHRGVMGIVVPVTFEASGSFVCACTRRGRPIRPPLTGAPSEWHGSRELAK